MACRTRARQQEFKGGSLSGFGSGLPWVQTELDAIAPIAWDAYEHSRKSPQTRKAGREFADPGYDSLHRWLKARESLRGRSAPA